jgi:hypothetical protein
MQHDRLLKPIDVRVRLGLGETTTYRLLESGLGFRVGKNQWRVLESRLDAYIAEQATTKEPPA